MANALRIARGDRGRGARARDAALDLGRARRAALDRRAFLRLAGVAAAAGVLPCGLRRRAGDARAAGADAPLAVLRAARLRHVHRRGARASSARAAPR